MFSILTEASSSSSGNKAKDWRPNMMNGGVPVSCVGALHAIYVAADATTGICSTYRGFISDVS
eukprot:762811-Hanusia_phi.AAC.3